MEVERTVTTNGNACFYRAVPNKARASVSSRNGIIRLPIVKAVISVGAIQFGSHKRVVKKKQKLSPLLYCKSVFSVNFFNNR